jgi:hypothetical protein
MPVTYQHGEAPADAPVTWQENSEAFDIGGHEGSPVWVFLDKNTHVVSDADSICRAFHLAKLAKDAAPCVQRAADDEDFERAQPAADWLRRFRAAKGDA